MGTAFAGIVRVPLTSVIMIFEITRDYSIIVPLMISNLISYFISSRLQAEPIYEALQHQDGIHLPPGANSAAGAADGAATDTGRIRRSWLTQETIARAAAAVRPGARRLAGGGRRRIARNGDAGAVGCRCGGPGTIRWRSCARSPVRLRR